MNNALTGMMLALAFCITGCTTIPDRFTRDESMSPDCGYHAEPLGNASFALEVFLKSYSFFPSPDAAVQEARECYSKTAALLAKRQGKMIKPITSSDMNTSPTRNIMDGYYSVYVTGKVVYASE